MFLCSEKTGDRLPDVTIYAGDNTPWCFVLTKPDGSAYPYVALAGNRCVLTFMPFSVTAGMDPEVTIVPPVLTIDGTISSDASGVGTVIFSFDYNDTISLHGKFIYQVEIYNGDDVRIRQGYVTIRHNTNRPVE